jgi:hypothetical protein
MRKERHQRLGGEALDARLGVVQAAAQQVDGPGVGRERKEQHGGEAVGRVAARVLQISSNSVSKFSSPACSAPRATPIAAATPIAGAPRMIIVWIASATSL